MGNYCLVSLKCCLDKGILLKTKTLKLENIISEVKENVPNKPLNEVIDKNEQVILLQDSFKEDVVVDNTKEIKETATLKEPITKEDDKKLFVL